MKISKVNHTRAAVSAEQRKTEGILYHYPVKKKNGELIRPVVNSFDDHFDDINKNAKRLYGILRPEIASKTYGRTRKVLRSKIKQYFRKIVKFNYTDPQNVLAKQRSFIAGHLEGMVNYCYWYDKEPDIHALVSEYLRKSLRKNVVIKDSVPERKCNIPEVTEKIIRALCVSKDTSREEKENTYKEAIAAIEKDELEAFLDTLNADYTRSRQRELIKNSIEKQNVKASVVLKDNRYILQPSFAEHLKKKAVYEFMLAYVDGDDDDRVKLLDYMRGLIILYICGSDVYNELRASGIVLRDFSSYLIADSVFCVPAASLLREEKPKALKKRLRREYEYELVKHYKEAIGVFEKAAEQGLPDEMAEKEKRGAIKESVRKEAFWIVFIEQEVKGILDLANPEKGYKNNAVYLCRKVWNRWTAFMAEKYIDFGKAVYHFAIPAMPSDKNAPVKVGIVKAPFREGLTSFDYEHIKAVENMERSVSIAVTFAVNNFSRSALKKPADDTTDVLFLKDSDLDRSLYCDTGRRILRYFGGISQWQNVEDVKCAAEGRGDTLFFEVREQLEALRNGSYHYTQKFDDTAARVLPSMLEVEKRLLGPLIREKYFSNNTHWFYPIEKLERLMETLYRKIAVREDQIPAFSRLYNRERLFTEEEIFTADTRKRIKALGTEKVEIFQGAAFFLFKEIYYYAFLRDPDIVKDFRDLVFDKKIPSDNPRALKNFRERIKEIPNNASMGEVAQTIMTDYNLQNQQKETAQLAGSGETKADKEKYKSFPMILYKFMRLTFIGFLRRNQETFGFLYAPEEQAKQIGIEKSEFCAVKMVTKQMMFSGLSLKMEGRKSVAPWYVLGHMISPSHLNHLSGNLRSYICYLRDIDNRAYRTGNKRGAVYKADLKEISYYKQVLEVLEFCRFFCGRISNLSSDYFTEGQYTKEIFKYVDAESYFGEHQGISDEMKLASFCRQPLDELKADGTPQIIGLYHDGTNEILNRNIVRASLYGTDKIIQGAADKVTETDIRDFYRMQKAVSQEELADRAKDSAENAKRIKEVQNKKNRVELVNVKIYSDILNDLVTQLVSWAYFRERDLMYLALGAQYMRIFHGKKISEESVLRKLKWRDVVNIQEGAVLYQIVAMYTYHLPLYQVKYAADGRGIEEVKERIGKYGYKKAYFEKYCHREDILRPVLYFFEVEKDQENIRSIRNYIDHFSYFVKADKSILDLYSDFYNMFFSYSENFRKSISFILPNILSKYFVLADIHLSKKTREAVTMNNVRVLRNCAGFDIDKELKSYQFTYNIKASVEDEDSTDGKEECTENTLNHIDEKTDLTTCKQSKILPVKIDARDAQFLKDIKQILRYSNV